MRSLTQIALYILYDVYTKYFLVRYLIITLFKYNRTIKQFTTVEVTDFVYSSKIVYECPNQTGSMNSQCSFLRQFPIVKNANIFYECNVKSSRYLVH